VREREIERGGESDISFYYKDLFHVMMEVENSQNLQCELANWRADGVLV
jgi:hypothetical protein